VREREEHVQDIVVRWMPKGSRFGQQLDARLPAFSWDRLQRRSRSDHHGVRSG
jgi:hypothetical protein